MGAIPAARERFLRRVQDIQLQSFAVSQMCVEYDPISRPSLPPEFSP